MIKICKECGKTFETDSKYIKICSDECRKIREKKKDRKRYINQKCVCTICNKEFIGNRNNKYCSDECKSIGQKMNRKYFVHNCIVCGNEFKDKSHQSKYCSKECKKIGRPKHYYNHTCVVCGNVFENMEKESKYCSRKCQSIKADKSYVKDIQNKKIEAINEWLKTNGFNQKSFILDTKHVIVKCYKCNKERKLTIDYFKLVRSGKRKYLGCPNCDKDNFKKARTERLEVMRSKMNYCNICGKYTKNNLIEGMCPECKDRNDNTHKCIMCGNEFYSKEEKYLCRDCISKENKINKIQAKRLKFSIVHICKNCGKEYRLTKDYKGKIYCSNKCAKKYENKQKDFKRRNRLKENGEYDSSITLDKLFKKDKGICKICGKKCDYEDYVYDDKGTFIAGDNYPSIDHMIPISKGGKHIKSNVQLAHRKCNSIKNNKYVQKDKGQLSFF